MRKGVQRGREKKEIPECYKFFSSVFSGVPGFKGPQVSKVSQDMWKKRDTFTLNEESLIYTQPHSIF